MTAERPGRASVADGGRQGGPDGLEIVKIFVNGHLEPEAEQDPKLVMKNIRGNRRPGHFFPGWPSRQVE